MTIVGFICVTKNIYFESFVNGTTSTMTTWNDVNSEINGTSLD
jgi:hypothetical protein